MIGSISSLEGIRKYGDEVPPKTTKYTKFLETLRSIDDEKTTTESNKQDPTENQ